MAGTPAAAVPFSEGPGKPTSRPHPGGPTCWSSAAPRLSNRQRQAATSLRWSPLWRMNEGAGRPFPGDHGAFRVTYGADRMSVAQITGKESRSITAIADSPLQVSQRTPVVSVPAHRWELG